MTDKYIIVIPSYNRVDIIQVKTLALLRRHGISSTKINIFVANQEEYDLYNKTINKQLYNKLIIGVIGLKNQRNFIMKYYPEGTHIVQMDDDLDNIVELVITKKNKSSRQQNHTNNITNNITRQQNHTNNITNNKVFNKSGKSSIKSGKSIKSSIKSGKSSIKSIKSIKPITNLDKFIIKAFNICNDNKIFLWGVYPLANAYFMTPSTTTDLRFIVGPFWGIINRHKPELQLTINEKENSERTLQHWTYDKTVLRFNYIGIDTKYYTNKGGLQSEGKNRQKEALKSVHYLHNKYPTLTKIYLGKKSGMPELKFIKQKKK